VLDGVEEVHENGTDVRGGRQVPERDLDEADNPLAT
jgi:hypothetical protein